MELQDAWHTDTHRHPCWCMSLCDLAALPLDEHDIEQRALFTLSQSGFGGIERIYAGSYFCDRLLCSLPDEHFEALASFCSAYDVAITLVLPIFSQCTLEAGSERIDALLTRFGSHIDEVTVNDYALAERLAQRCREAGMRLNWGRLFFKALRDPRYTDFTAQWRTCEFDAHDYDELQRRYPFGMPEFDPFAPAVDFSPLGSLPYALHLPHCFITTGHICEAASSTRDIDESFRAGMACARECERSFTLSHDIASDTYYLKHGRTVYFENNTCRPLGAEPARLVWSAADFRCSTGAGGQAGSWE